MSESFVFPKSVDECKTLSFDDAGVYLQKEQEAGADVQAQRELAQWTIETTYGEAAFAAVKSCNRTVNDLFLLITRATFGLSDEVKNSLRSGSGEQTQTA